MNSEYRLTLLHCFICRRVLQEHPLYPKTIAKWCPEHGDFFVQIFKDKIVPTVIFKPFYGPTIKLEPLRKYVSMGGKTPFATYTRRRPGGGKSFIMRCDQTGDIYIGTREIAKQLGVAPSAISNHLNGMRRNIKGYTFTRLDKYGDKL